MQGTFLVKIDRYSINIDVEDKMKILMVICIVISYGRFSYQNPLPHLEDLIKTRNLRSVGYTHFDVSYLQETADDGVRPANAVNSDILRRRKRDVASANANVETTLHLVTHGDKFILNVQHSKPVLHPNAPIVFVDGDVSHPWKGTDLDCFMTGRLTSHDDQTVVFSYCDNLKGYFHDANYTYWVESLEHHDTSSDASSKLLVARKPGGSDKWRSLPFSEHDSVKEKAISKAMEMPGAEDSRGQNRQKRNTQTKQADVTVELAIVCDAAATEYYNKTGAKSEAQMIEGVLMKWYGVVAEFQNPGVFYHEETITIPGTSIVATTIWDITVTISIKTIEIWTTNPAYITVSNNLQTYQEGACADFASNNKFMNYDTIFIETGVTSSDARSGNAGAAGTCTNGRKCAISNLPDVSIYNIEAHELGHTLNMVHDYADGAGGTTDTNCHNPYHGIMGFKYNGWSSCSTKNLATFVGTIDAKGQGACLWEENVNTAALTVIDQWMGMVLTDDEVCEEIVLPGWKYRPRYSANQALCPKFTCVDTNIGSSTYGSFRGGEVDGFVNTIMGRRCGDNMYCYINNTVVKNQCIPWSATGLADSMRTVRAGAWGAWGPMSECDRTCGTGMQVRKRKCNNPTPLHSPFCEGSEYEASFCSTDPCPEDDTNADNLKTQRAGETCARLNANSLIGTAYEDTGTKFSNNEHGQCEVKCNVKAGQTGDRTRFGLMPDGTPCSHPDIEGDMKELFKLSTRKGRDARCLQGQCYLFGCDFTTGTTLRSRDNCGECGGDGSTCAVTTGNFNSSLLDLERVDLVTVPAGAKTILVMYEANNDPGYWIELWSESGTPIIAKDQGADSAITDNLDNPTTFAGTSWLFKSDVQFLSADGPTNENVIIKVYKTGTGTTGDISYSYSVPSGTTATTSATGATTEPTTTTNEPELETLSKKEQKKLKKLEKQRKKQEAKLKKQAAKREKQEAKREKQEAKREKQEAKKERKANKKKNKQNKN